MRQMSIVKDRHNTCMNPPGMHDIILGVLKVPIVKCDTIAFRLHRNEDCKARACKKHMILWGA
jgi:hypothetical protein